MKSSSRHHANDNDADHHGYLRLREAHRWRFLARTAAAQDGLGLTPVELVLLAKVADETWRDEAIRCLIIPVQRRDSARSPAFVLESVEPHPRRWRRLFRLITCFVSAANAFFIKRPPGTLR